MEEFLKTWYGALIVIAFDIAALSFVIAISYRWMFKRILDFLASVLCIVALSPIFLFVLIWSAIEKRKGRLEKTLTYTTLVGEKGKNVQLSEFAISDKQGKRYAYGAFMKKSGFYKLSKLFDLFLGKISIVGVKALTESDCVFLTDIEEDRHLVKPGLINPLVLKGTKNTDYEEMLDSDKKYAWRFGFFDDCKIFLVWLLKKIRGERNDYLGQTREKSYAETLLEEERITQADYDEAISVEK